MKKTLYVSRKLLNGDDLYDWAKKQTITHIIEPSDMHVTVAFSKKELNWNNLDKDTKNIKINKGDRSVVSLGTEGAVVLKFESNILTKRWNYFLDNGASWDHEEYKPHVTFTYYGKNIDMDKIKPYDDVLIFGPEIFKEVDLNYKPKYSK